LIVSNNGFWHPAKHGYGKMNTETNIFLEIKNYLSLSSSKILLRADRSPFACIEQLQQYDQFLLFGVDDCVECLVFDILRFSLNLFAPQPFVHSQQRKDVKFFLK
jgi:hypothetical protein